MTKGKREYGEGVIRERVGKNGTTFQAMIFLGFNPDGSQNRPTKTFPKRVQALAWLSEMKADSRRGALVEKRVRVQELLTAYIEHQERELAKGNLKPSTLRDYRRVTGKLRQVLPNVELTKLTSPVVEAAIARIAENLTADEERRVITTASGQRRLAARKKDTPKEASRALLQLRRILKFAEARGWTVKNVARHIKPHNTRKVTVTGEEEVEEAKRVWEPSQVVEFLKVAQSHRLYALFYLKLSYGFRIGELMGLMWGDLDFERREIKVVRTYSPPGTFGPPKWGSQRTIPITEGTVQLLREHKALQERERLAAGADWTEDRDMVFATARGTLLDHSNVRRVLEKLMGEAGVPRLTPHGLRHTAASAMIRAGYDVVLVAKTLGHKDPSITLKVYAHLFDEHRRAKARDASDLYALPKAPSVKAGESLMN